MAPGELWKRSAASSRKEANQAEISGDKKKAAELRADAQESDNNYRQVIASLN